MFKEELGTNQATKSAQRERKFHLYYSKLSPSPSLVNQKKEMENQLLVELNVPLYRTD